MTERLIEAVHAHPVLWDKRLKEYKDRTQIEKSWMEVASKVLGSSWNLNEEAKKIEVDKLRIKWKNIRDAFIKSIQSTKSGEPNAPKKKKYVHSDSLEFLLEHVLDLPQKRSTSGINPAEEEIVSVDTNSQPAEDAQAPLLHDEESPKLSASSPSELTAPQRPEHKKKDTRITPFQHHLLSLLSQPPEPSPNESFLKSLLPHMDQLDEDQILEFKQYVLAFFVELRKRNPPHTGSLSNQSSSSYCQPDPTRSNTHPNYSYPHEQIGSPVREEIPFDPLADDHEIKIEDFQ